MVIFASAKALPKVELTGPRRHSLMKVRQSTTSTGLRDAEIWADRLAWRWNGAGDEGGSA